MATVNTLPDELTNKIIMMTIPTYVFMHELKTTIFVRWGCDCEGCTHKHYLCYYYEDFNYRLKPTKSTDFGCSSFSNSKQSPFNNFIFI